MGVVSVVVVVVHGEGCREEVVEEARKLLKSPSAQNL